jgi:hypothetical protein
MSCFKKNIPDPLIPTMRSVQDAVDYFSDPLPDPLEIGNPAEELFRGQVLPRNVLVLPFIKRKLRNQLLVQKYVDDWKFRVKQTPGDFDSSIEMPKSPESEGAKKNDE